MRSENFASTAEFSERRVCLLELEGGFLFQIDVWLPVG